MAELEGGTGGDEVAKNPELSLDGVGDALVREADVPVSVSGQRLLSRIDDNFGTGDDNVGEPGQDAHGVRQSTVAEPSAPSRHEDQDRLAGERKVGGRPGR